MGALLLTAASCSNADHAAKATDRSPAEPSDTTSAADAESPDARVTLEAMRREFHVRRAQLPTGMPVPELRPPLSSDDAIRVARSHGRLAPTYTDARPSKDVEVSVPEHASEPFHVRRKDTGMSVSARLVGAADVPAQTADGFAVYPRVAPGVSAMLHKVTAEGTEDYLRLDVAPAGDEVAYDFEISAEVAGLRLVGNMLEFVNRDGTPELRVAPPYLIGADGAHVDATLDVTGCAVDRDPRAPWGRAPVTPGASQCRLLVSWEGGDLEYPALLDPSWSSTSNMGVPRSFHVAMPITGGKVLVAGGAGTTVLNSAELYDPSTRTWAATGSMATGRVFATATNLFEGSILVVGGWNSSTGALSSVEVYSPLFGDWSGRAAIPSARTSHAAMNLANGLVLIAGGYDNSNSALTSTWTFEPLFGTWTQAGNLVRAHSAPTLSRISNGRALLVGPIGTNGAPDAQIYTESSRTWASTATPLGESAPRTAIALPDGKVLVAGNYVNPTPAQLFDPATAKWTRTGSLSHLRLRAATVLLNDGRVLMTGGQDIPGGPTAELFNSTWGTWSPTPDMSVPRYGHTATVLGSGRVLIAGGTNYQNGSTHRTSEEFDPTTTAVTSSEYRLPATTDPDIDPDRASEVWAVVHRPTTLSAQRYPVVLMLHGNHATCGRNGTSPRLDDKWDYTTTGACPSGYTVVPSHRGYDYVGTELASRGYIVVSINSNRLNYPAFAISGPDAALIRSRGRLALKHLQLLSQWNRGAATTPSSIGVSLQNRLDLSQVGLMGHSRGGEAMRSAYSDYRASGSAWPGRIVDPVNVRGIFEIGPTDKYVANTVFNPDNTRWAVLVPMCDGDLASYPGMRVLDRMVSWYGEGTSSAKAAYVVWGANHNYYNTEWQVSDGTCTGHRPMWGPTNGTTGSAEQRQTGFYPMLSFFLANVGSAPNMRYNSVFDMHFEPVRNTRVDRAYTPGAHLQYSYPLEDFAAETGRSKFGFTTTCTGCTFYHASIPRHEQSMLGAKIDWTAPNQSFQVNLTAPGQGFNFSLFKYLQFRMERADSTLNPATPTPLTVDLINSNGSVLSVPVDKYVDLVGPVGNYNPGDGLRMYSPLQTARIPISAFGASPPTSVQALRFTFSGTSSGSVYLAAINVTNDAAGGATTGIFGEYHPGPTVRSYTSDPAPAALMRVVSPSQGSANTVDSIRVRSSAGKVEVDLGVSVSPAAYTGNALPALRIGSVESLDGIALTADGKKLRFIFPRAAFDGLKSGEPIVLKFDAGPDWDTSRQWVFGALDRSRVTVSP